MEEKEKETKSNINNITMETSFQSPVAMIAQKKYANMSLDRQLVSCILVETIKILKGCTIQSTINNYLYYHSDEQVNKINNLE